MDQISNFNHTALDFCDSPSFSACFLSPPVPRFLVIIASEQRKKPINTRGDKGTVHCSKSYWILHLRHHFPKPYANILSTSPQRPPKQHSTAPPLPLRPRCLTNWSWRHTRESHEDVVAPVIGTTPSSMNPKVFLRSRFMALDRRAARCLVFPIELYVVWKGGS